MKGLKLSADDPDLPAGIRRQLQAAALESERLERRARGEDSVCKPGCKTGEKYSPDYSALAPTTPARARPQPGPGRMNKTEAAYDQHLGLRLAAGELVWYRFEAIKLRLAPRTFYTPDFAMIMAAGELAFHEVKGHWEDDARVKIKVAAEMYPFFLFMAVQKVAKKAGGGWRFETFSRGKCHGQSNRRSK